MERLVVEVARATGVLGHELQAVEGVVGEGDDVALAVLLAGAVAVWVNRNLNPVFVTRDPPKEWVQRAETKSRVRVWCETPRSVSEPEDAQRAADGGEA
jgi:hypothetical protein